MLTTVLHRPGQVRENRVTEARMITLILTLIILGVLWYLVDTYIPMPAPMRTIVRVVILLAVVLYLARFFGVL
jgi:uncharacterized membrane protein